MDAALTAALGRVADSLDTLAEAQRQTAEEVRATRGVCQRILDALTDDGESPVADALRALADQVAALEETQGALVPGVNEIVTIIRLRAQQRNGH